jgi:phage shock protein A
MVEEGASGGDTRDLAVATRQALKDLVKEIRRDRERASEYRESIEESVDNLEQRLHELERLRDEEEAIEAARQSAWTAGQKVAILLVALAEAAQILYVLFM